MDTCKACGAEVEWVPLPEGGTIPLDMDTTLVVTSAVGGSNRVVQGRRCHHDTCRAVTAWKDRTRPPEPERERRNPDETPPASFLVPKVDTPKAA